MAAYQILKGWPGARKESGKYAPIQFYGGWWVLTDFVGWDVLGPVLAGSIPTTTRESRYSDDITTPLCGAHYGLRRQPKERHHGRTSRNALYFCSFWGIPCVD